MREKSGSGKRRRWGRRLFCFALISPVLVWAILSLIFSFSFGTRLLSSRIEKKLGLSCEIDRLAWTPWSGFVVKGMVLSSPADFSPVCEVVKIESITVNPGWKELVRKQISIENLDLDGMAVTMPVELLAYLAKKSQGPPLVLEEEPAAEVIEGEEPEPAIQDPDQPTEAAKEPSIAQTPHAVEKVAVAPAGPITLVSLQDISLKLYSINHPTWKLEAEGIAADFPVGGPPASGKLELTALSAGGGELFRDLSFPLTWDGAALNLPEQELETRGFRFALSAAASPVSGLPYGIRVTVPEQALSLSEVTQMDLPVSVEKFAATQQINGYLKHPRLVQGTSYSTYQDVVVQDQRDGSTMKFDWGHARLQLLPAGLSAPDFRWLGEHDAILGNGHLTASGNGVVVVRLVGSPERAEVYERRAKEFRQGFTLRMRPLETPDRYYSDVRFDLVQSSLTVSLEEEESSPNILP